MIWWECNISGLVEVFWMQGLQNYPSRSEHVMFSEPEANRGKHRMNMGEED